MNDSFMMKVAWESSTRMDSLWVRVVKAKYGFGNDLKPMINKDRHGSNLWRGIKAVWDNFDENCDWTIVNQKYAKCLV